MSPHIKRQLNDTEVSTYARKSSTTQQAVYSR